MNITHKDLVQKQETQDNNIILYPERFIQNTDNYNALMMMYRCAIREISTKLEVLDDEFSVKHKRNPISSIKSRIKQPDSIYRKLKKNGYDFTEKNIREQLNDVAGIRVTCPFINDIYTVAKLLADQDDITVLRIKDYIQNPKENGWKDPYAGRSADSYHWHGLLGQPGTPAPIQKRPGRQYPIRFNYQKTLRMRPRHHCHRQPNAGHQKPNRRIHRFLTLRNLFSYS